MCNSMNAYLIKRLQILLDDSRRNLSSKWITALSTEMLIRAPSLIPVIFCPVSVWQGTNVRPVTKFEWAFSMCLTSCWKKYKRRVNWRVNENKLQLFQYLQVVWGININGTAEHGTSGYKFSTRAHSEGRYRRTGMGDTFDQQKAGRIPQL